MPDNKSFSAALLAVCQAISCQFKVNSLSVFRQIETRKSFLRRSGESSRAPEIIAKNSDVAGCRDAASAAVSADPGKYAMSKSYFKCAALIGRAEGC